MSDYLDSRDLDSQEGINANLQMDFQKEGSDTSTSHGDDKWKSGDKETANDSNLATKFKNPKLHPMYGVYTTRINKMKTLIPGVDINTEEADKLFLETIKLIGEHENNSLEKAGQYPNPAAKSLEGHMNSLESVTSVLKELSSTQFEKFNKFNFWNGCGAKDMAKKNDGLALETSGLGSLFDGMGSFIGDKGYDTVLWTSISRAYAEKAVEQMKSKEKSIHVYTGGDRTPNTVNIANSIELISIKKGLKLMGKDMQDHVTFHSVAVKTQKGPIDWDYDDKYGKGIWLSNTDQTKVCAEGNKRFDQLPTS